MRSGLLSRSIVQCGSSSCFGRIPLGIEILCRLGDVVQAYSYAWLSCDQPRRRDLPGASFHWPGHDQGRYLRPQIRLRKYAEEKAHRMVKQTETEPTVRSKVFSGEIPDPIAIHSSIRLQVFPSNVALQCRSDADLSGASFGLLDFSNAQQSPSMAEP